MLPVPATRHGWRQPVEGGGDLAALFNKDDQREEGAEVHRRARTSARRGPAQTGGFISPHKDFDVEHYPNKTPADDRQDRLQRVGVRFDGSDLMPGKVGAGTFWKEHDGLDLGPAGRGDDAEQHRRQLADKLADGCRVPGGAPRPAPRPRRPPLLPAYGRSRSVVIKIAQRAASPSSAASAARMRRLLGPQQARRVAARPVGGPGQAVRSSSGPAHRRDRRLPDLPGDPDRLVQLRQRGLARLRRLQELHRPADRPRLPADAVQHPAVDHHRPGGHRRRSASASPCWPTGCGRAARSRQDVIFLPMAISMVGAATIWRFVYEYQPAGHAADRPAQRASSAELRQATRSPGCSRTRSTLNSLLLMVILIWAQVGFSMVLLSAAIKGVPDGHPRGRPHRRRRGARRSSSGSSSRRSGRRSSPSSSPCSSA